MDGEQVSEEAHETEDGVADLGTKICIVVAILGVLMWYANRQPPPVCPGPDCPNVAPVEPDKKPWLPIPLPKPKPRP
jgi:hypothetical protein